MLKTVNMALIWTKYRYGIYVYFFSKYNRILFVTYIIKIIIVYFYSNFYSSEDRVARAAPDSGVDEVIETEGWINLQKDKHSAGDHRNSSKIRDMHSQRRSRDLYEMEGRTFVKSPDWVKITGPLYKCTPVNIAKRSGKFENMFRYTDRSKQYEILKYHVHKMSEVKDEVGIISVMEGYHFTQTRATLQQGITRMKKYSVRIYLLTFTCHVSG